MGMFDNIRYKENNYQTKDTPNQFLDNYEIRDDGTLWVEDYDAVWQEDDNSLFGGYIEKFNVQWIPLQDFTGEIRFYRNIDEEYKKWEEFSSYFIKGQLKHLEPIDSPGD